MSEDKNTSAPIEEETLSYNKAPLYKRWFATFIDIFIMAAIALLLYGLMSIITNQVGGYKDTLASREKVQEDSGLYIDGVLITTSVSDQEDVAIQDKKNTLREAVETYYYNYLQDEDVEEGYEGRKRDATDNMGSHYFVEDADKYVEGTFPPEVYYEFYVEEIENYALPTLSLIPEYNRTTRIINITSVAELFASFAIGYTFSFILMPLFIKRGRRTVGMFIFKISLISDDALNVVGKRLVARNLLSFFLIYCLSCFTFGVPVLVSLTMMHLSKKSQSFLDYMTGTYVVDSSKQDVYLDYSEYEARHASKKEVSIENKDLQLTNRKPGTY